MKQKVLLFTLFSFLILILSACSYEETPQEDTTAPTVQETTIATAAPTTVEETEPTLPIVLELTEEETQMLLKIGMAERGQAECTECIALVMCTVLNRVNADKFGSSIYGVLHAPNQFTPVGDGTYAKAEPNEACHAALDMVIRGWDESQGALYYEFCQGESWHSKNLQLLTQHCDTRFYK